MDRRVVHFSQTHQDSKTSFSGLTYRGAYRRRILPTPWRRTVDFPALSHGFYIYGEPPGDRNSLTIGTIEPVRSLTLEAQVNGATLEDRHVYQRWPLSPGQSIAPLIQRDRRGIYVLEFANGELYVGQSVNVVSRFATHIHGYSHHEPWADTIAIRFRPILEVDLAEAKRSEIQRLGKTGHTLRNKTGDLGHERAAPLDHVATIEEQHHWAVGAPNYELGRLRKRIAAGKQLHRDQGSSSSAPLFNNLVTYFA